MSDTSTVDATGNHKSQTGAGKKLLWFGLATGIWLIAASLLAVHAHHPKACLGYLPCLQANEWGDFLAGVFAPVAFMWLVATVWIQSDELKAQRKELELTRIEFKRNRDVIESQVEEAKKQAEFIGEQTKILREEADAKRREKASVEYRELIEKFVQFCTDNTHNIRLYGGGTSDYFPFYPGDKIPHTTAFIANQTDMLERALRNFGSDDEIDVGSLSKFEALFHYVYSAEELEKSLPYVDRLNLRASRLNDLVESLCTIIERSPQLSHLLGYVKSRDSRLEIESKISSGPFADATAFLS